MRRPLHLPTFIGAVLACLVALATPVTQSRHSIVLLCCATGAGALLLVALWRPPLLAAVPPSCALLGAAAAAPARGGGVGPTVVLVLAISTVAYLLLLDAAEAGGPPVLGTSALPAVVGLAACGLILAVAQLPPLPWLAAGIGGLVAGGVGYRFVTGPLRAPPQHPPARPD